MEHFFDEFRLYALVALGIGLVIFVHELGHFLAARWCGVRVETFSLGFGPKLLGWKRGPTTYQLSAVPLGGYVKMAGEESAPGRPAGADELPSKSVGQRFLIFSGGVIMNVIFALVVFPIILMAGVPLPAPVVGAVEPGGPAWNAGVVPGTRILAVNGIEVKSFGDIAQGVALGPSEATVLSVLEPGGDSPRLVRVIPHYDEEMGFYTIGVRPGVDPKYHLEVPPGSAVEAAGLRTGDRLVEVVGAPAGLRLEQALEERIQATDGASVVIERGTERLELAVQAERKADPKARLLGFMPVVQRVKAVRSSPLVAATGVEVEDRILEVDGVPVARTYDFLRALHEAASDGRARLRVLRGDRILDLPEFPLAPADAITLERAVAVTGDDLARVYVLPGSAALEAGIRTGDRIVQIGDTPITRYQDVLEANRNSSKGTALAITVERTGAEGARESLQVSVTPRPVEQQSLALAFRDATEIYQAENVFEAARVGVASSWKFAVESWLTLKRILLGHVASRNIGGIITIGVVSHSWASEGIAKLLFFLCMLSMNLAFLNVLPIPVLDGGHLLFLLIEKVKGSPVSERVLAHSQMVGVVLIVSLMVYVTFNDVMRWIIQ